jgi:peptidoglycan/LPS O-acetylase OafA/YrhL
VFIPYLGYYLYGFFAREMTYKSRRNKVAALATIGITALVMVISQFAVRTSLWRIHGVENATQIVANLSPPVILMSLLVFPLFKDPSVVARLTRQINKKWIISLGECSFGIYLIHPILQLIQGKFVPNLFVIQTTHAIPMTLLLAAIIFFLSWLIVWTMRQVPVLRSLI